MNVLSYNKKGLDFNTIQPVEEPGELVPGPVLHFAVPMRNTKWMQLCFYSSSLGQIHWPRIKVGKRLWIGQGASMAVLSMNSLV